MSDLLKSIVLWRGNSIDKSKLTGYPPAKCMNLVAKPKDLSVDLTWTDPDDIIIDGGNDTISWEKTILVRKIGSCPKNDSDGTIVVTSTTKNQYQTTPYTDTGLTNGTTYYYAAFSYSSDGSCNEEVVSVCISPTPHTIMTVRFTVQSSPDYGTYLDDAVDMPYGKGSDAVEQWQEFFGYRPCLFKDGAVVGYLNPNDYTKFVDGTSADITSGNAGDVMVEFPRRGIKISKSDSTVTVSMTREPDNPAFTYYAHNKGTVKKDYFYVGAYLGYNPGSTVRSLSGKTPSTSNKMETLRTYAANLGDGYTEFTFYQYVFIQCMYLLQYKGHTNSQLVHGYGWITAANADVVSNTGFTDKKGMMYGTSVSDKTLIGDNDHVKLFGLEDLWGNISVMLEGIYIDDNGYLYTATRDYANYDGYGYYYRATASGTISGPITETHCTSECGFFPYNAVGGTVDGYWCDSCGIMSYSNKMAIQCGGGTHTSGTKIGVDGIFHMENSTYSVNTYTSCRLAYL